MASCRSKLRIAVRALVKTRERTRRRIRRRTLPAGLASLRARKGAIRGDI
jgi:hypothetical protein